MKIVKRNGTVVDFDIKKIESAIGKAKSEVDSSTRYVSAVVISELVADKCREIVASGKELTVENVQDIVEDKLIEVGEIDVAKGYIRYRHEREKVRPNKKKYQYLSDELISDYKHREEPFKFDIGKVTYYRTYSRPVPEENRREFWWETVARVVEFSSNLEYQALMRANGNVSMAEVKAIKDTAIEMYDMIFNLKLFPSGRSLWVANTPVSYDNGISNFNCSFLSIDDLKAFSEMLLVLMLGTGVGLSVEKKYIDKLPKVNTKIEVIHKKYKEAKDKKEHTELINLNSSSLKIVVGDSRFGWSKAIEFFLEILTSKQYSDIDNLIIDYDNIRPYGSRIKTFGGHASGMSALETIFQKISDLFPNNGKQWVKIKPIHALDIAASIAEGVVAGGKQ